MEATERELWIEQRERKRVMNDLGVYDIEEEVNGDYRATD